MKRGFTLVEALIAISILIIGILSGFILVTRALYNVSVIQDRLTASFLAQEGIELVRNIRDTNYIKILNNQTVNWRDNLQDGCYIIESNVMNQENIKLKEINCGNAPNLKYNDSFNIYTYSDLGNPTPFYREIKIETINNNEIRVISFIKWTTKNIKFDLTIEDHLFNWFSL